MMITKTQSGTNKVFTFSSLICLTGVFVMIVSTFFSIRGLGKAYQNEYHTTSTSTQYVNVSTDLTMNARGYVSSLNKTYKDSYEKEVNTDKQREKILASLDSMDFAEDEKAEFYKIDSVSQQLAKIEDEAFILAESNQKEKAIEMMYSPEYLKLRNQAIEADKNLKSKLSTRTTAEIAKLTRLQNICFFSSLALLVLVTINQIMYLLFVTNSLIKPVNKLMENMMAFSQGKLSIPLNLKADQSEIGKLTESILSTKETLNSVISEISHILENISGGNLDVYVTQDYKGDFAPIKTSLEEIITSLNNSLEHIAIAANQVNAGSDQVSAASQSLAQGATEQAGSIDELSAAIRNINNQISKNAKDASEGSDVSIDSEKALQHTNEQMNSMVEAMNDINAKADEIQKINKTIEDIAFQTNILALNAAVEAARAGGAGKGFAVVADEVRNLANKSAEAASHTTELIESTIQSVQSGTVIVDQTAQTLHEVMDKSKISTDIASKIAKASEDQSEAIGQINTGIEQISVVVENNSATAQQSAAASQELFGQAQILEQTVSQYRLRKNHNIGVSNHSTFSEEDYRDQQDNF